MTKFRKITAMKKVLIFCFCAWISYTLAAQTFKPPYAKKKLNFYPFTDTGYALKKLLWQQLQQNKNLPLIIDGNRETAKNKMPVVGYIPPVTFKENNGNGFDLYQSPLDNMIVARPDSTYHAAMPKGLPGMVIIKPPKR